ncbi:MAG: cytochrome d ubiquinol oxidase subunit II [candidate division Zixibacteria bacterium]|nr:cytochrome d ubiquinol oxidase subunit II [candidate division Zixibacteria bacterium]
MIDLNTVWFVLFGILIAGYAILDGFDLGVGVLHLFTRSDKERRISMNSIGPVWDGNEVWLLTAGGALFAAFPPVYATVFSGFYLVLILLLAALIFRAVSLEFRSKVDSQVWRRLWDMSFGIGSLLPAILFGVAVGNILKGIPINAEGTFTGTFLGLLNPYAILIGILSLIMFTMHGALYMTIKTDGELQERFSKWASGAWVAFVILYLLATLYTFFEAGYLFEGSFGKPFFWVFMVLLLIALVNIPITLKAGKHFLSLLSSSVVIASVIGLSAVSMYPKLVPSSIDLTNSLTAYNASSTPSALTVMLIITLIGMPLVIGYTIYVYHVFKGKTVVSDGSY